MKALFLFNKVRTHTAEIANVMSGKGHDNHFFGMFRLRKYGIETNFIELEQFLPRWLCLFLRKYILNIFWVHLPLFPLFFKYDVVISSTAYGPLLLKAVLGIKKFKWVVIDFNISGTIGTGKSLKQKIFRYAVSKGADGVIAISRAESNTLKQMFPHLADRIVFFYEGVDTHFFKPDDSVREENFILSVGLDPSRDFKTLIDASQNIGTTVRLATKPERLKGLEPLPENVTARLYPHDEMLRQYIKAKIVVVGLNTMADNNDSMGTFAVIEAMSMGKAVVATKTSSMESYIENNVTGVLVPHHDVDTMRATLKNLLVHDERRREMGRKAREFIVAHADAEIFAQKLSHYLSSIVSKLP